MRLLRPHVDEAMLNNDVTPAFPFPSLPFHTVTPACDFLLFSISFINWSALGAPQLHNHPFPAAGHTTVEGT
jgi:hypothetical protein